MSPRAGCRPKRTATNAYLQLLVTVGGVGFILAMIAFLWQPLAAFFRARREDLPLTTMLFALFAFMVLHNFLESDFLEATGPPGSCSC